MNQELRIRNKKKSSGFTLIELLIVIVVIGVLATIFMSNFIGVRERARDSKRKQDLRQIQAALELYRYDRGIYPDTVNCNTPLTYGSTTYMQKVSCDPLYPSNSYYYSSNYYYNAPGNPGEKISYTLCACLENTNDNQGAANLTCEGASPPSCSTNEFFVLQSQ